MQTIPVRNYRWRILAVPAVAGVLAIVLGGCPPIGGLFLVSPVVIEAVANGGANGVTIADFNGDGLYDLASVWKDEGSVHLHLQQRGGTVISWSNLIVPFGSPIVPGAQTVLAVDVNSDGLPDLLAGTDKGQIIYLRQLSGGTNADNWNLSNVTAAQGSEIRSWVDLVAADLDGDNAMEIIAAMNTPGGRVSIFNPPPGAPDGSNWTRKDVATYGRAGSAALTPIDVDGDGDVDVISIASREETESVVWFENPGHATALTAEWTRHAIGHVASAKWLWPADVDQDGRVDLVVSSGTGKKIVWFQKPANAKQLWTQLPVGSLDPATGSGVAAADIDGDGVVEIIYATGSEGQVGLFEPATTQWTRQVLASPGGSFDDLIVFDLDQDGLLDILTTRTADTSEVLWYRQVP